MEGVFVHRTVYEYIVSLVEATRNNDRIELGVSPRGALALARMSKAAAYVEGREYVLPRDVASVFINVARHRIVLSAQGRMYNESAQDILAEIFSVGEAAYTADRRQIACLIFGGIDEEKDLLT